MDATEPAAAAVAASASSSASSSTASSSSPSSSPALTQLTTTTTTTTTMIAKYGKLKIELPHLPTSTTSIYQVKELLCARTGILPKRQKILGLKCIRKGNAVGDDTMLSELKSGKGGGSKGGGTDAAVAAVAVLAHQFILMGTPEEKIFVDPSEKEGLVDIIDDFDLDFNAGSDEWIQHKAKEDNLQKFTDSTDIHIINPPRLQSSTSSNTNTSNISSSSNSTNNNNNNNNTTKYKPLLVLDLDHTLLDFSSKTLRDNGASAMDIGQSDDAVANQLKRPYMDEFLTWTYKYYDLVVWSQTSWRWLEVKCLFLLNCALHRNMPSCHLYIDIPSKKSSNTFHISLSLSLLYRPIEKSTFSRYISACARAGKTNRIGNAHPPRIQILLRPRQNEHVPNSEHQHPVRKAIHAPRQTASNNMVQVPPLLERVQHGPPRRFEQELRIEFGERFEVHGVLSQEEEEEER
mmetsp:Transcript_23533/g.42264  ORF Transcript_23533/g.42264 Transcript_23533/m.42264 type:complete len:462 (+) Transcript_23533:249-1634(+)